MPKFNYKAVTASGRTKKGTVEAADRHLAIGQLRGKTRQILSLTEEKSEKKATGGNRKNLTKPDKKAESPVTKTGKSSLKVKSRFTSKELVGLNFLKRLLELHSSGMPLGDSVRLLSQRISDPQMKSICSQLWKELSEGRTLAASLATMPSVFGSSVIYVIEAGEQTGELVPILEKEKDGETNPRH